MGRFGKDLGGSPEGPQRGCSDGQTTLNMPGASSPRVWHKLLRRFQRFPASSLLLLLQTPSPNPSSPLGGPGRGWLPTAALPMPNGWTIPSWLPSELPSAACCSSTWRKCLLPPLQEKTEGGSMGENILFDNFKLHWPFSFPRLRALLSMMIFHFWSPLSQSER